MFFDVFLYVYQRVPSFSTRISSVMVNSMVTRLAARLFLGRAIPYQLGKANVYKSYKT